MLALEGYLQNNSCSKEIFTKNNSTDTVVKYGIREVIMRDNIRIASSMDEGHTFQLIQASF